ncbi:hypothetical protein N7456_012995 [Penicillium angulare]|uniref:Uncharacterized protein n=1 Tax=Penicillium angulare TaxID=116970 RepID=A0A9W9EKK4_9EURO|nr:hypothetical protein N7456_012995 [Penicillium angulare]
MATQIQSLYPLSTSTYLPHTSPAMDELINKYSLFTTTSAPSALLNKRRNPFQRFIDRVQLEYYRYEVTFGLYVMTPSEKWAANTIVLTVLILLLWALVLYFPSLLYVKLSRLMWLLTGRSGQEAGTMLGILDKYGNPETPTSIAEQATAS